MLYVALFLHKVKASDKGSINRSKLSFKDKMINFMRGLG